MRVPWSLTRPKIGLAVGIVLDLSERWDSNVENGHHPIPLIFSYLRLFQTEFFTSPFVYRWFCLANDGFRYLGTRCTLS